MNRSKPAASVLITATAAFVSAAVFLGSAIATEQPQPVPATKPAEAPKADPAKVEPPKSEPAKAQPGKTDPAKPAAEVPKEPDPNVLVHTVQTIDGKDANLADYKGKVVVIVNVASRCGFKAQLADFEKLYKEKKDAGLVILAFPSNDFGGQEPGTNEEIKQFCQTTYSVTFPMFSKIKVKGPDASPLFKQLASQKAPLGGEPAWNFTKFIVDRSGKVVARFETRIKPDDQAFVRQINDLLKQEG